MADANWKIGDVVELKSGGPKMTVSNVAPVNGKLTVWCVWFDGPKKDQDTFAPETLRDRSEATSRVSLI